MTQLTRSARYEIQAAVLTLVVNVMEHDAGIAGEADEEREILPFDVLLLVIN